MGLGPPVPTVAVEVEIAILQNSMPEPELRIIARQQDGNQSYFYQKLRTVNGKPVVTERKLTFGEYQVWLPFLPICEAVVILKRSHWGVVTGFQ